MYKELFEYPQEDYESTLLEVKSTLEPLVAEEIEDFVIKLTDEALFEVTDYLKRVRDQASYSLQRVNNSETEEERSEAYSRFIQITNPSSIQAEIQQGFQFNEIRGRYQNLINYLSKQEFGDWFSIHQLPSDRFDFLKQGLYLEVSLLFNELLNYSQELKNYMKMLQSINANAKWRQLFGIGSSIAIPGSGILTRTFMKLLHNDQGWKQQSFTELMEAWNQFSATIQEALYLIEQKYRHVLISLYGGLFLSVQKHLKEMGLTIQELYIEEKFCNIGLDSKEAERVRLWAYETTMKIQEKEEQGHHEQALIIADQFYHYVHKQPLVARVIVNREISMMYYASLWKYITLAKRAERLKKKDTETFLIYIEELFRQLPQSINAEDLQSYNVLTPTDLSIYLIHFRINEGSYERLGVLLDYVNRMRKRWNEKNVEKAEDFSQDSLFTNLVIALSHFMHEKEGYSHSLIKHTLPISISPTIYKEIQKEYRKLTKKDAFYLYLNEAKWGTHLADFLTPLVVPVLHLKERKDMQLFLVVAMIIILIGFMINWSYFGEEPSWEMIKMKR